MKKPTSLYYICHVKNLPSILANGLLSRAQAKKLSRTDIHDEEVLARREKVVLPNGKPLLDHVNLYFQPRNAMLYRLTRNADRREFVILQINPAVLETLGMFFSNRNAAASGAVFYGDTKDLKNLDEKVFKRIYWSDNDDSKQKMMAEVLIPDVIGTEMIMTLYSAARDEKIANLAREKNIEYMVDGKMFFCPQLQKKINDRLSLSQGDMFFSNLQTFTISVNLKGIMGKGLASRTKYQFPDAYVRYQDDCKYGRLKAGKPTLYKRGIRIEEELADDKAQLDQSKLNGNRWFLFIATKRHWRGDSRFEDIEASMQWLLKNYKRQEIQSIALPALGCGLGNLHWKQVGPMMCYYLNQMCITSCIYLPMEGTLEKQWIEPGYLLHSYQP